MRATIAVARAGNPDLIRSECIESGAREGRASRRIVRGDTMQSGETGPGPAIPITARRNHDLPLLPA